MLAEWAAVEIYLKSPCPGELGYYIPCDKVVGYDQIGNGLLLIGAGGIILLFNWVIYPAKAAAH